MVFEALPACLHRLVMRRLLFLRVGDVGGPLAVVFPVPPVPGAFPPTLVPFPRPLVRYQVFSVVLVTVPVEPGRPLRVLFPGTLPQPFFPDVVHRTAALAAGVVVVVVSGPVRVDPLLRVRVSQDGRRPVPAVVTGATVPV